MDDDSDFDDCMLLEAVSQVDRQLGATKPRAEHLQCLQSNFGHNEFRPKQWDIIRSIIEEKRDNCVVMPTGYGKSLCFQFPPVYSEGMTLVVSPLISLMQDQVSALSVANIPACFLGSAQTDRTVASQVIAGYFRMVYVSPEYLSGDYGKQLLRKIESKLTLIAIDESHCISAHGHAFRPDYRKLGCIRKEIPSVPILAVTATATQHVRDDIISSLRLKNPQLVSMGFDRPNIHFTFKPKSKNIWDNLKPYVTNISGSVIVYVLTKSLSEEIAKTLQFNGVKCDIYHAGLSQTRRRNALDDFIKDRLKIIVATVAFGMGIDKPDVRCVVHYGASRNIESYYQEVGRAGRDGQPSTAITFHDKADFQLHEWFLSENHEHQSESVIKHMREIGQKMRDFCYASICRRKYLLEYFDSDSSHIVPRTKCCDNCDSGSSRITLSAKYDGIDDNGNYDFTESAYLLLRAIQITSKVAVAILVLKASCEKKAFEYRNEKEVYGAGKAWPKEYWTHLVDQLKAFDYITLKKLPLPFRPIKIISQKGIDWLRMGKDRRMILEAKPEMYQFFKKKRQVLPKIAETIPKVEPVATKVVEIEEEVTNNNFDPNIEMNNKHLEDILLGIRAIMAEKSDCMPYLVATNTAIQQMVQKKPISAKEFKAYAIDGFSSAKIEKFAAVFIDGILKFMENDFSLSKVLQTYPLMKKTSNLSQSHTQRLFKLIQKNMSLSSICQQMELSESQIIHEIIIFMKSGFSITNTHLKHLVGVTDEILTHIKSKITSDDFTRIDTIKIIKMKFADASNITETMLELVLNYLKVRHLMRSINVPFFDIDDNQLVNGNALLESNSVEAINLSIQQSLMQPNEEVPLSQNSQWSDDFVMSKEEMDIAMKIADNIDKKTETMTSAPLKESQNVNKTDMKQFQVKPPVKMSSAQTTTKKTGTDVKRGIKHKASIVYISDSDSDDFEPQTKRKAESPPKRKPLEWISTKKH